MPLPTILGRMRSLGKRREADWSSVQRRLERTRARHPRRVRRFVQQQLDRTASATVVAGLSRHPYARHVVRDHVAHLVARRDEAVERRLRANPRLAGAIAGAANLLLDDEGARAAYRWVRGLGHEQVEEVLAVLDSFGARPRTGGFAGPAYARLVKSRGIVPPSRKPVRHRLVVTDTLKDRDALALLIPGAEKTTVFPTSDATGKTTFDAYTAWPGFGDVSVEHFRTRISRFSRQYVELHEATAKVAAAVTSATETLGAPLGPGDRSSLELAVADFVFFQTLKAAALQALLDDERFDQIVVAVGDHGAASGYVQMLASLERLREDPRVEIVSVARSDDARAGFWRLLFTLSHPRRVPDGPDEAPGALDWGEVMASARELVSQLGRFSPDRGRDRVLFVTSTISAYTESAAAYAALLAERYDLRILHYGATANRLRGFLEERLGGAEPPPIDFLAPTRNLMSPLGDRLVTRLQRELPGAPASRDVQDAAVLAWLAAHTWLRQISHLVVLPHLVTHQAMRHWMQGLVDSGTGPDVIVLTPQRNVAVSSMASVAREQRIPSVALEPHIQDANYCRYAKVMTDYYGVVSSYFRTHCAQGFDIDIDRIAVIGSPRLVAPVGHDPAACRAAARAELADQRGITFVPGQPVVLFFAQPSSWEHVERVWQIILKAAHTAGARVLLKPHPEESPTRIRRYLTADGAEDVVLLSGTAQGAIELADIVLTAYSTGALDAALHDTPVICVSEEGVDYPVDMASILEAPLARSVSDLTQLLEDFRKDPSVLRGKIRRFLEHEPQFVEGPASRLQALVARAIEAGGAGVRPPDEVPASRILDAPHPTFRI